MKGTVVGVTKEFGDLLVVLEGADHALVMDPFVGCVLALPEGVVDGQPMAESVQLLEAAFVGKTFDVEPGRLWTSPYSDRKICLPEKFLPLEPTAADTDSGANK